MAGKREWLESELWGGSSVQWIPVQVPIRLVVRPPGFLPYRSRRCLAGLLVSGVCEADDAASGIGFYWPVSLYLWGGKKYEFVGNTCVEPGTYGVEKSEL
jgi:hypothetical protein